MACMGCAERGELLVKMREAYRRGDMSEAKRLLKEMLGSALKDVEKLSELVMRTPDGMERFDFTSNKPKSGVEQ